MACLRYLLQKFGFDNYGELEELELFEARYNIDVDEDELEKKICCRFCWRLLFFCFLSLCIIIGCIFISMIFNPTCLSKSKLDWYEKSPIYVINIAPLLSRDGKS